MAESLYSQKPPARAYAMCAQEASAFRLMTTGEDTFIAYVSDDASELHARFDESRDGSAVFAVRRAGKDVLSIPIADLSLPDGWITEPYGRQRFTITWSNGGGLGGWGNHIFSF